MKTPVYPCMIGKFYSKYGNFTKTKTPAAVGICVYQKEDCCIIASLKVHTDVTYRDAIKLCKTEFNGHGYAPGIGELEILGINPIWKKCASPNCAVQLWSSTNYDSYYAWLLYLNQDTDFCGIDTDPKGYFYSAVAFCKVYINTV